METITRLSSSDFDFNDSPLDKLPQDIRSLIERVVICQDQYEMPTEQEITKVLLLAVSRSTLFIFLLITMFPHA